MKGIPPYIGQVFSASLLLSFLNTMLAFSFAAMMVHATQPQLLPDMIMVVLFTALVSVFVVAWKGSLKGLIAAPLSGAMALFSEMFRNHQSSPEEIWLLLFVGGSLTALLIFILGWLRLGRVVRYLPLPVLAGFLAGVGWLFIKGGLLLVGVEGFGLAYLGDTALWVAVIFGLGLSVLNVFISTAKLLPSATLLGGLAMVLLAPHVQNGQDWFFHLEGQGGLPLTAMAWITTGIPDVQWLQLPWAEVFTLICISTLFLLLHASSVELKFKQELQLDHEMKVTGVLNMVLSALGGVHGALSFSQTALADDMRARYRLTGIFTALFLGIAIFCHGFLVQWLPIPLVVGILVFQGIQLLNDWLIFSGDRFLKSDRLIIVSIFIVILFYGYLGGVLVGLILTILLFVREYSRMQIIYLNTNLLGVSSGVERTIEQQDLLNKYADFIRIYQLRGYVFFGSAHTLVEQIKTDIKNYETLEVLVLDFRRVRSLDASAVNSVLRLIQFLQTQGIKLYITEANTETILRLKLNKDIQFVDTPEAGKIYAVDCLEMAIELIEDDFLGTQEQIQKSKTSLLKQILQQHLNVQETDVDTLLSYFTEQSYADGQWIIEQGSYDETLYLLASGQVDVGVLDADTKRWVRFKKMLPGTLIGEMGLYQQAPRSAHVKAIGETLLYQLTQDALTTMEQESPQLAIAFHRFVVLIESERLRDSNRRVYSLLQN